MAFSAAQAFKYVVSCRPRDEDYDFVGHLNNAAIARVLADARAEWFSGLEGRAPGGAFIVRKVTIWYESESRPGEELRCGVLALSRSNRSLLLQQMLWSEPDQRAVARAEAVHLCFDQAARKAVPVWPELIAAVEKRQEGPLPIINSMPGP